jgi:CRP/FNR family transcriptional regulator
MDTIDALKTCQLCRELSDDELSAVAEIVTLKTYPKDGILFLEGDPSEGIFSLIEGKVRIYKATEEGKEFTIHIINPGQLFAEAAIFGKQEYPANCIALKDSVVAFFPKQDFIALLHRLPEIALKLIASLSSFLREYNQLVENLSLREVQSRLSYFLLKEYERIPGEVIILKMSKSDLADRLGTANETLSRNFRKLSDLEIISVSGREIRVLDPAGLAQMAKGEKT